MPAPIPLNSAWRIPIDDPDLAHIGMLCALWGNIEAQADLMLQMLLDLDVTAYLKSHGKKQVGSKIDDLKQAASNARTPELAARVVAVSHKLKPLATDRNHVVHGQWGFEIKRNKRTGNVRILPGAKAVSIRRPQQPFPASKLPLLVQKTAEMTWEVDELWVELSGLEKTPIPPGGRSLHFGAFLPKPIPSMSRGQEIRVKFEG